MAELLYRFEETGVGCKAHRSPDCLCDVKPLPGGVPIKAVYLPGYLSNEVIDGDSFTRWAQMAIGGSEALKTVDMGALDEALGIWEGKGKDGHTIQARSTAVSRCLKAGLTIDQTARWLGATRLQIMDLLWPDRERHELILRLEEMIRARMTTKQIVEVLGDQGVTANWVSTLAYRWNVKLPHANVRYGPEIRAKARRMVRSGLSRREAARRLGLSESKVSVWCSDLPSRKGKK